MSPFGSLVFGLGLFFLGLRLVSENLTGLAGNSLRGGFAGKGDAAVVGSSLGFLAGALMQSATAVTFISAGMVAAGVITFSSAISVILWSNVGLTLLPYVATLNIHPYVALFVGWAGIAMGVLRKRAWRTMAAVFLGMGLILLGLEEMGQGAAPLKHESWFQSVMDFSVSSPVIAFFTGCLVAALLQSNTGANMMLITLAGAGALSVQGAAVMIYGANLGAIALRFFLAAGMRGEPLRLVRFEDLFCLWSGTVMMILFYLERAGVPGVLTAAQALTHSPEQALAVIFTLSNAIPALLAVPLLGKAQVLLRALWPQETACAAGKPRFLHAQAIEHPATALELLRRELANLLSVLADSACLGAGGRSLPPCGEEPAGDFQRLATEIEKFFVALASRGGMNDREISQLQRLRAVLSGIRHLEEAIRFYNRRRLGIPEPCSESVKKLDAALADFLQQAAEAIMKGDRDLLSQLQARSRRHGAEMESLRAGVCAKENGEKGVEMPALMEDFELVAWTFHRIVKMFAQIVSTNRGTLPQATNQQQL